MFWQSTYVDLALDRQRTLLHDADVQRLAREAMDVTPHFREWLARRLIILALLLAPSLRPSLRGLVEVKPGRAPSLTLTSPGL